MGLAAAHYRVTAESIRNGEGDTAQMQRAQKLINEMRTSVPDFNEHANTYTQLAKYLATDKTCSPQDVVDAYNSIKQSLESRGKQAKDEDVMQVLNQFKEIVRDPDINFLYQNAQKSGMSKDQLTDFLVNLAQNNFGTATWKSGVMTYLNNIIQTNNKKPDLPQEKGKLKSEQDKLRDEFLNTNENKRQIVYQPVDLEALKQTMNINIQKSSDVFK